MCERCLNGCLIVFRIAPLDSPLVLSYKGVRITAAVSQVLSRAAVVIGVLSDRRTSPNSHGTQGLGKVCHKVSQPGTMLRLPMSCLAVTFQTQQINS